MRPNKKDAENIIKSLETTGFYVDCPCCGESMGVKKATLFFMDDFPTEAKEIYNRKLAEQKQRKSDIKKRKIEIPQVSQVVSRAVNVGHILERMAPAMRGFQFERGDCRSLFDPIDYIVFQGMTKTKVIENVIFMDIKSGNARLNNVQREIKNAIENKNVSFDVYEVEK